MLKDVQLGGPGPDVITLTMSEDAFQGDAQFYITIDGVAVGGLQTASASHTGGNGQDFTFNTTLGSSQHIVGVQFVNDAYGGSAATDRNLFVNAVKVNGVDQGTSATLMSNGTAEFTVGPLHATVPVISPAPTPSSAFSLRYGATADVGLTAITTPHIPAGTDTLTVGVGKQFSTIAAAIGASRNGDVILVDGGTYTNDFANVNSKISLIAVGGRVTMNATVDTPNQKGILVAETDLTVIGFTFSGAHISDDLGHNAAGIRVDNGNIVLINDEFTNNQNGILTNPGQGISVTIDHSVFNHNGGNDGNGAGNIHNIYVGDVKSFTMTNSISEAAQVGHEIKSRAETNVINNNLIISGVDGGTGSYDIDLPNGGKSTITNNTIIKGSGAENHTMVHFGGEGIPYAGSSLAISGNLFENTADGATGVLNQTSITAKIANNKLDGLSYSSFVSGPAAITSTFDSQGVAYADSVLTGVLPGSTIIYDESDTSAHAVTLNGGAIQAVQGGGGLLTVDVVAGHIVAIGGSGGMVVNESAISGTGGNQYTTAAGSVNALNLTGGGSIDSEGSDSITVGDGNSSGQLNGTSVVVQAGQGTINWGVNGTSTIQAGVGSTFVSLGSTGNLTLTGANSFFKVDSGGGTLRFDTVNSGDHVSGTASGAYTMQTYDGTLHMTTAGGSQGVMMTMADGKVQFISKGADEFHAGAGDTLVQVSGNARIYAGTGKLDFYGMGSSGADLYGNGGAYYLGGDTGNVTYHGGDLASTLNNDLGRGTILGGAGRLTVNGSARDRIIGGSGGVVLNQNGGGADTITTAVGSTNVLNLTGGNDVTSNGADTITWGAANGSLLLNGTSSVNVLGGSSTFIVAGSTAMAVAGGHDSFTLLSGATASLDLHGYHSIHGDKASLALHFTNDQGAVADMGWSGGILDAWSDNNGGIHAETSGAESSSITASGSIYLQTDNAAHVLLGGGTSHVTVMGKGSDIVAGSGSATINGGWLGGTFSVTGGTGAITADSGYMDMTFIGGSGSAALSGGSVSIVGGSGAITATGNGVKSFVGGTGTADLSLADGANVLLGAGASHFTEKAWGSADLFTLTANSIGNAVIDGFRVGTDQINLTGGVKLTAQTMSGGTTHLLFSNGGDITLSGVGVALPSQFSLFVASPQPESQQSSDPLFDAVYYLAKNPDVSAAGVDPYQHYVANGYKEGRNPDAFFDSNYYLTQNPDVKEAGINPLQHFEAYGWKEGRQPSLVFDDAKYLAANPDVKAAALNPLAHYLAFGQVEGRLPFLTGGTAAVDPLVDTKFYDTQLGATLMPTEAMGAQQAAWSYDAEGWQKGLNPDAFFDTNYYLAHNPDVAAAHVNPLTHFETYGWKEGRDASAQFSTNKYLVAYTDVRAAGMDPLLHYIGFGQAEGRSAFGV